MIQRAKDFIKKYKFNDIFDDNYTKEKRIIKEFIEICNEIHVIDFDIPAMCPNCALKSRINQGLEIINLFINRKTKTMEKSKCNYRFKKGNGIGILVTFKGNDYTNANLTDEVAEQLIKHNSKNINLFDVYPKNINIEDAKIDSDDNNQVADISSFTDKELFTAAKLKGIDLSSLYKKDGELRKNYRKLLEKLVE